MGSSKEKTGNHSSLNQSLVVYMQVLQFLCGVLGKLMHRYNVEMTCSSQVILLFLS